jgi:hypothetical protein
MSLLYILYSLLNVRVQIANKMGLQENQGSNPDFDKILEFCTSFRQAAPIQRIPESPSLEIKQPERETNDSLISSSEVKNEGDNASFA